MSQKIIYLQKPNNIIKNPIFDTKKPGFTDFFFCIVYKF